MASFNPARDLGPRVFSALAGWGGVPFRVNGAGWWAVYIVAPVLGGLLGGGDLYCVFQAGVSGGGIDYAEGRRARWACPARGLGLVSVLSEGAGERRERSRTGAGGRAGFHSKGN